MRAVVLVCGVFDLLHVAHVRHLREARSFGDMLIAGVTMDKFVNKEGRPIIPQGERVEMVRALACVSSAFLCRDSLDALQINPGIFCKGHDYTLKGLLPEELAYCAKHGIQIRHTRYNPQTTSGIIERIRECESA